MKGEQASMTAMVFPPGLAYSPQAFQFAPDLGDNVSGPVTNGFSFTSSYLSRLKSGTVGAMQEGTAYGMTHAPRFPDETELVARCLRDTLPADRAEILRALAELLGSLRRGEPTAHPWTARPGQSARRRRR